MIVFVQIDPPHPLGLSVFHISIAFRQKLVVEQKSQGV